MIFRDRSVGMKTKHVGRDGQRKRFNVFNVIILIKIKNLTLKRRKKIYFFINLRERDVVKVSKYIVTLKNDLFGCFTIEENVAMTMKQV